MKKKKKNVFIYIYIPFSLTTIRLIKSCLFTPSIVLIETVFFFLIKASDTGSARIYFGWENRVPFHF
jgi:hypothetical protein